MQETVMIPADLMDHLDKAEEVSGVIFTRVVVAALLRDLLDPSPRHPWMSYAIRLAKGDIDIDAISQMVKADSS